MTNMEKIAKVRQIVEEKTCARISGVMIDLFSASKIMVVYENLKPENQVRFTAMPIEIMMSVAYKVT